MEIKLFGNNVQIQNFSVSFQFPVYFTRGIFNSENPLLLSYFNSNTDLTYNEAKKILIVVDENVLKLNGDLTNQIQLYFEVHKDKLKVCPSPVIVPGGEKVKNEWTYVLQILEEVDKNGIDRHSYIMIIGGGAVLDMGGFAASIAHRGIRHIRIPTTVLSQNDSGVGVKNGINLFNKKNFIGSFLPPNAVFNDFDFLDSLDIRDWRAGIAEAIKVALIKDRHFFEQLESMASYLSLRDKKAMQTLIIECAKLHMDHISNAGDPFEKGSSRPLDFGHWAAHKLEQMDNFKIRHGEAVAIGIAIDSIYSFKQGWINSTQLSRILELLLKVGFQLYHPLLKDKCQDGNYCILEGIREFREHLGGKLTVAFLNELGQKIDKNEIDISIMKSSIDYLLELYSNEN